MVGFTPTPTVDDSTRADIRGYTMGSDRSDNITLNIKLQVNGNLSRQLCENTKVVECILRHINGEGKESTYRKAEISDGSEARVGVFSAYAENGTRNATATIIVHHAQGTLTYFHFTRF